MDHRGADLLGHGHEGRLQGVGGPHRRRGRSPGATARRAEPPVHRETRATYGEKNRRDDGGAVVERLVQLFNSVTTA